MKKSGYFKIINFLYDTEEMETLFFPINCVIDSEVYIEYKGQGG